MSRRSGVLGPRFTFAEQRGDDGDEDRSDHDLGGEGEPETPACSRPDKAAGRATHDAQEDGHETADGLHARNQDPGDKTDNDAGTEAGEDAVDFHTSIQPLNR